MPRRGEDRGGEGAGTLAVRYTRNDAVVQGQSKKRRSWVPIRYLETADGIGDRQRAAVDMLSDQGMGSKDRSSRKRRGEW